ncbi:MAG TPA: Na(+)-translocating NADH-quinone reductase subunit C [Gammaproteobacteria bacterium]|nr:Na(+)-translocating NADH-quinone reductase subunit C [Gammaproteobacteria bacterium]
MSNSPEKQGDNARAKPQGGWRMLNAVLEMPNDSPRKTLIVAVALCLVCSIVVSSAAVLLRPLQVENAALDRKRNIVEVAGLLGSDGNVEEAFRRVEPRVVDLETGEFAEDIDPARYDQRMAAKDPARSIVLSSEEDIAGVGRRAKYATVYLVRQGGRISQVILPVHGYGLWSTLYGFLALEGDFRTVSGLKFYEHAETPGLGGEVDNPAWREKWDGKVAFDENGNAVIEVVKGNVDETRPGAEHRVDGLAGATLTTRGVNNLVNFWLGENGFGPFLARMRQKEA